MEIVTELHLECLFDADEYFSPHRRHSIRASAVARLTVILVRVSYRWLVNGNSV